MKIWFGNFRHPTNAGVNLDHRIQIFEFLSKASSFEAKTSSEDRASTIWGDIFSRLVFEHQISKKVINEQMNVGFLKNGYFSCLIRLHPEIYFVWFQAYLAVKGNEAQPPTWDFWIRVMELFFRKWILFLSIYWIRCIHFSDWVPSTIFR